MASHSLNRVCMNDAEIALELLRLCPVALSVHDLAGEFRMASEGCEALFGRSREALIGTPLADLVADEDVEVLRCEWARAQITKESLRVRYRLRSSDPAPQWIETEVRQADGGSQRRLLACSSRRIERSGHGAPVFEAPQDQTLDQVPGKRTDPAQGAESGLMVARRHRDMLVDMLPAMVWYGPVSPDLKSYKLSYISDYLFRVTGYTPQEWFETPGFWRSQIHPDDLERTLAASAKMMSEGTPAPPYRFRARDGRYLWLESSVRIERDKDGMPVRMHGMTLDVTRFKEVEVELERLNRELQEKAEHILELSAPLLPIGDGVLVLPLIGTMDPERAQHALTALLNGVASTRARRVIIDLTGVGEVDAKSAAALLRAAQAVRLLGAQAILTGIRPEIASALVQLGHELSGITTYATLRAALRG